MKCTPVRAVALTTVASLLALNISRVGADQSSPSSSIQSDPARKAAPASGKPSGDSSKKTPSPTAAQKQKQPDRQLSRGERLARTALSYRGAPYRFGGQSSRSGFDCSGLVQAVCAKWGIYLPRAANAQFSKGTPIKPADLQPGDLVFFKNTYRHGLSHVGIYIGNGLFIHAASRSQGVIVSNLNEAYHRKHWAGARRLALSKLPPVEGETKQPMQIIIEGSDPTRYEVPYEEPKPKDQVKKP